MLANLEIVIGSILCRPVYHVWDQAVNKSFCTYAVPGLFSIWLCHLFTGFFLYIILIIVSWFHDAFSPVQIAVDPNGSVAGGDNHQPHAAVVFVQGQEGYEMVSAVEVAPAGIIMPSDKAPASHKSEHSHHNNEQHQHQHHHNEHQHQHNEHQHQHQHNNNDNEEYAL